MSTPMSALFHNFLLADAGQHERIDYRTITHFDRRIFQLLGKNTPLAIALSTIELRSGWKYRNCQRVRRFTI